MKVIDKIALAIFTVIVFIVSVTFIVAYYNLITIEQISNGIEFMLIQEPNRTVFFAISMICFLLSLKVILFDADSMENNRKPITIENEKGILEIMPESIENIALIEVSNYASVLDIATKMKLKKDGIIVNVACKVLPETNICDLNRQLQDKIKEKIERQTGSIVKSVNLKIKDVKKPKETKSIKED